MDFDLFDTRYEFPNTIEEIDELTGKEFEKFLAEYFKLKKYDTSLTDDNGDRGIDVLVKKDNKLIGIQAKRWKTSTPINEDAINKILAGKNYHHPDEIWLITTTTDITRQARNTAENNNILIRTRNLVIDILKDIKENPNAKFKEKKTTIIQPQYQEKNNIPIPKQEPENKSTNENIEIQNENDLYNEIKTLRYTLSKKYNLYPIYMVFGNDTITEITEYIPIQLDELKKIKGLGEKKISLFGNEILQTTINYITKTFTKEIDFLKNIRERIKNYNNINSIEETFDDITLINLIICKPSTLEELTKTKNFPENNIPIFGNYLLTQLKYI
jgi:hypothetical protein